MKKAKRHYLLAVSILAFSSFCYNDAKNCKDLRNGTFYYFTKKSRERIDVFRQDSLQLESTQNKDDVPLKNKIVWKSDCEFDMFINRFSDSPLTGDESILARTPANVKIIHVDSTFYVCIAKIHVFGEDIELRDTLFFGE